MKQDIKQHISNCRTCFTHKPAKTEVKHIGLTIPLEDLSPMDWLSTDLMEIKDKSGNKSSYLVIVDRALVFIRAYNLPGTKTKNISVIGRICGVVLWPSTSPYLRRWAPVWGSQQSNY